jgi:hypothetical protein
VIPFTFFIMFQVAFSYNVHHANWDQVGMSSYFATKGDKMAGGPPACLGGKPFPRHGKFCAHRTLRCGSVVLVYMPRTGKTATCTVIDRGPYGAMYRGKWVLKTSRKQPGRWRGIIDLGPAVAKQLEHTGLERVKILRLEK